MDTETRDVEFILSRVITWSSIAALILATILLTRELEKAQRPSDFVGRVERSR